MIPSTHFFMSTIMTFVLWTFSLSLNAQDWIRTDHVIHIGGERIEYTATVGELALGASEGNPAGVISFTSYKRKNPNGPRPLSFVFNGGPGSASIWLHMGAFGPKRVMLDEKGQFRPDELGTLPNESTLLKFTDLVFIDPVGTGYSRVRDEKQVDKNGNKNDENAQAEKKYFSVQGDANSVAEFIHLYVTRTGRWASPKYVIGESYGTLRAVLVSEALKDRHEMSVAGIVLIGSALDFGNIINGAYASALSLPSMTAIAWELGKLGPELQNLTLSDAIQESRNFAKNSLFPFLVKGIEWSTPEEQEMIWDRMAHFTGLQKKLIKRYKGKIQEYIFRKKLLKKEGKVLGRFDGTYVGDELDAYWYEWPGYDPSSDLASGGFNAALRHHFFSELGVKKDQEYKSFSSQANQNWDWGKLGNNRSVNVSENLNDLIVRSPKLKVFFANGYFDLATPFLATEYLVSKMELRPQAKERVWMKYYEGGHMMYTKTQARKKLASDLESFFQSKY